jgi:hypothetical protein
VLLVCVDLICCAALRIRGDVLLLDHWSQSHAAVHRLTSVGDGREYRTFGVESRRGERCCTVFPAGTEDDRVLRLWTSCSSLSASAMEMPSDFGMADDSRSEDTRCPLRCWRIWYTQSILVGWLNSFCEAGRRLILPKEDCITRQIINKNRPYAGTVYRCGRSDSLARTLPSCHLVLSSFLLIYYC